MTAYRTRAFNFSVRLQTLLCYVFSKLSGQVGSLLGLAQDHPTDPAWIRGLLEKKFGRPGPQIKAINKSTDALPGLGLIAMIYRLEIQYAPEGPQQTLKRQENSKSAFSLHSPRSLVVKQDKDNFHGRVYSTFFQNAREAIFYGSFVPRHSILASCVPDVLHSHGSQLTGKFIIVMEDLTGKAVPAIHMLGNQCWGPPVPALPAEVQGIGELEILSTVFGKMAEVHARFWMDEALLKEDWMKGVAWRKGRGRWRWEAAFDNMRARWRSLRAGDGGNVFTSLQTEAVDRLLAGTEWGAWQRANGVGSGSCFTLTHGDFHAGNILWRIEKSEDPAVIVDWSEVGMGCPFTELAQFMISNTSIEFRRENERRLFDEYYQQLVKHGVDSTQFPPEMGWERYKAGGIDRWLQMFILLAAARLPEFSLLWFSRQVDSFLQDHYSSVPNCFTNVYCSPPPSSTFL